MVAVRAACLVLVLGAWIIAASAKVQQSAHHPVLRAQASARSLVAQARKASDAAVEATTAATAASSRWHQLATRAAEAWDAASLPHLGTAKRLRLRREAKASDQQVALAKLKAKQLAAAAAAIHTQAQEANQRAHAGVEHFQRQSSGRTRIKPAQTWKKAALEAALVEKEQQSRLDAMTGKMDLSIKEASERAAAAQKIEDAQRYEHKMAELRSQVSSSTGCAHQQGTSYGDSVDLIAANQRVDQLNQLLEQAHTREEQASKELVKQQHAVDLERLKCESLQASQAAQIATVKARAAQAQHRALSVRSAQAEAARRIAMEHQEVSLVQKLAAHEHKLA